MGAFTNFLFNRRKPAPFTTGLFRAVPGRILPQDDAPPVRVMNNDAFSLTQSSFTLAVANTEYTIRGIATLSAVLFKARGGDVKLSFYEGQSNTTYMLIKDGQSLDVSVVPFANIEAPISVYAQSTTAGAVLELIGMRVTTPANTPSLG